MPVSGKKTRKSITAEKAQRKMLKKGKVKHLGFVEAVSMSYFGKSDGKAGLPRESKNGDWESPRLHKESKAYSEFCDRAWGTAQLDLMDDYTKVGLLIDEIRRKEEILEQLMRMAPKQPDETYFTTRMSGEEDLNIGQIITRRERELEKKNSAYNARVSKLVSEIRNAYTQLDELHNYIIEANNAVRLICERIKNHTEQRCAAYWNAAIRRHPEKNDMPVTPEELPESEAEITYTAQHKTLEDEAREMLARRERLISWRDQTDLITTLEIEKEVA